MLQLLPSPTGELVSAPVLSPREQLQALVDAELRVLARGIGEHLPCELVERVRELRARQAELVALL